MDAITSVKYRNLCFWIDDRDITSKNTLLFVIIPFSDRVIFATD